MRTLTILAASILAVTMVTLAQDSQDSQILDKLVTVKKIQRNMKRKLTADVEDLQKFVQTLEDTQKQDASEMQAKIAELESKVNSAVSSGSGAGGGSTYVRWGRKTCPDSASLVYEGVVGGKHYTHAGNGRNALCLTRQPQYDNTTKPAYHGLIYGAEYEYIGDLLNQDVPCAVCLVPQSTTIMVPATLTCPPGWTDQYSGHLAAELYAHQGTEFVCLDGSPEGDESKKNTNGFLFYYQLTKCGSLPCPPFKDNSVATCVVCSK